MDHPDYELEHWWQIDDLFAEALDRSPDERAAFLDEACVGTAPLRAKVEALLVAYDQADDFLNPINTEQAAALVESVGALTRDGQRIGPYQIVRELGRGGMGAVYLAERADGQFEQQVALKLIKRGMDSEAILRRFLHERQILARLQHPNVARLIDGGVSDEGQPYFAMEYVEGVPLTAYCDTRQLDVEGRLRLFEQVCHAVQYAHRSLVVHRDLKPSNMLVTEDGDLKLLDFGIAKLLGDEAGVATLTAAGGRAMTPEYAAPEQVRGEPVTTATDVYALGVLLYELLTGHRPYRFERRTPEAVAQVIGAVEPVRPSTAVSRQEEIRRDDGTTETITPETVSLARNMPPKRLRRRLSGDLDTVVLKALRKEPERRYASVEAFVEDIRCHLAGLPIQARKDTLSYRASKFVQRHKVGVITAALAVLSLLLGLAGTAWQAWEAARERDQTQQEADKAERVSRFMVGLFQLADPNHTRGDIITVREVLDSGKVWIDRELSDQPELRAELLFHIGEVYYGLGRYEQARQLWASRLALQLELYGERHAEVANTLTFLAKALEDLGHYETAEAMARRSLAVWRSLAEEDDLKMARILNRVATSLRHQGKYEEAELLLREALALYPEGDVDDPHDRTVILNTLAHVLRARGRLAVAESLRWEILTVRRAWWGPEHPEVAQSLINLAGVLGDLEDYPAAESLFHEGLAVRRKVQGEDHPDVAIDVGRLAALLHQKGDLEASATAYREALAMQRKLLGNKHPRTASTLVGLGHLLMDQDRPGEAEPLAQQALEIQQARYGNTDARTGEVQNLLGACLSALERYDEAEPLLVEGYNRLRETRGEQDRTMQRARDYLVAHYERRGLTEQAAAYR